MYLGFLASYWWAVLAVMLAVMAVFIFISGRGASGGLGGRTKLGWSKWQALSRKAGELQARIILTIFYFTLGALFGLPMANLTDPLRIKKSGRSRAWLERSTRDRTLDDARRQY